MNIFHCVCHSVGRPKHVRVMAGALEGDLFIGPKAEVIHIARSPENSSEFIPVCCV